MTKKGCLSASFTVARRLGSNIKHWSSSWVKLATSRESSAPALEERRAAVRSRLGCTGTSTSRIIALPEEASASNCRKRRSGSKWGSRHRSSYCRRWPLICLLGSRPLTAIINLSISLLLRPGNRTWPVKSS